MEIQLGNFILFHRFSVKKIGRKVAHRGQGQRKYKMVYRFQENNYQIIPARNRYSQGYRTFVPGFLRH